MLFSYKGIQYTKDQILRKKDLINAELEKITNTINTSKYKIYTNDPIVTTYNSKYMEYIELLSFIAINIPI